MCDPRAFLWLISAPLEAPDVWRDVMFVSGHPTVTLFWKVRGQRFRKTFLLVMYFSPRLDTDVVFRLEGLFQGIH